MVVTNNYQRHRIRSTDRGLIANRIGIVVLAGNGDSDATIYEVRVYSLQKTTTRLLTKIWRGV